MRLRLSVVSLLLCGLLAAPAVAADITLTTLARPTELATDLGVLLYSAYDAKAGNYRLMSLENGQVKALPVAPSARPFQADVGPTRTSHAFYVYSRCGKAAGSCDLYAFNPATGREQRSKASDPHHDDLHPTYWRNALAFVREYGTAKEPHQVVYERPSATSRRSQRLPGVPEQRCDKGTCVSTLANFTALELHGHSRLAQVLTSDEPSVFEAKGKRRQTFSFRGTELRLLDRDLTRSRRLLRSTTGIGGQSFTGLSFSSHRLDVSFSCLGDSEGCTRLKAGLYRYVYDGNPRYSNWEFAADAAPIYALATVNSRVYELRDSGAPGAERYGGFRCDDETTGPSGAPRCAIVQRDPAPEFVTIPAP